MIARAPGKVLLSGAYAVLEGAPAIVAAVDRYVTADASRPATLVTEEVRAALSQRAAPWFDASPLRAALPDGTSRKLGLGSSAAILVASLAAIAPPPRTREDLRAAIFPAAFAAHKAAQPGGSGVDIAASTFGGIVRAARRSAVDHALDVSAHALPEGLVIEVFACPVSASTADFLVRTSALKHGDPSRYRRLLDALAEGAAAAVKATTLASLLPAIDAQIDALGALGEAAGIPIVTPEVSALRLEAAAEAAVFGPSGAGGGDIAIYLGPAPSSPRLRARAAELGMTRLDLAVGAEGVHQVAS